MTSIPTELLAPRIAKLLAEYPPMHALHLRFADCVVTARFNRRETRDEIADYYRLFLCESGAPAAITLAAIDGDVPKPDLLWITRERDDPAKSPKEAWTDLPDGRLVFKLRTGVQMWFGPAGNVVSGDLSANGNQVINFINNRFIERRIKRGAVLSHAAGVAKDDVGLGLAGVAGAGKSSLALRLLEAGCDFVSNDRLLLQPDPAGQPRMLGVAKHPRINPGTALSMPTLRGILPAERQRDLERLDLDALWELEEKYDAMIDELFESIQFSLEAPLKAFVVLMWDRHATAPMRVSDVTLADDPRILAAIQKSPWPFYWHEAGPQDQAIPGTLAGDYHQVLAPVRLLTISGGVDFDGAVAWLRENVFGE